MNIRELITALEELVAEHGEDVEVRLAQQPNWPFEYSLSQEPVVVDLNAGDREEAEIARAENGDGHPTDEEIDNEYPHEYVVYLAEGSQLGYLPGEASKALGWR